MSNEISPPKVAQKPHTVSAHGQSWEDPWFWLREKENPDVIAYLEAENAYTKAKLSSTEDLQKQIYSEIRGRIKEADSSVPSKKGPYWYYRRFEKGGQYPIYCRKKGENGKEEIVLDVNQLAEGNEYLDLGILSISPDHLWCAYSIDTDGSERYTIKVKNLETGEHLAESIPNTYTSFEWAADNKTFFYVVLDEHLRPLTVFSHVLGEDSRKDPIIYKEKDPQFFVGLGKSLSEKYIFIHSQGSHVSEVYYLSAEAPEKKPVLIEPRTDGVEYSATHHGKDFYIRTNYQAKDFKIVKASVDSPARENWEDVVAHQAGTLVTSVEAFKDYLVVERTVKGLSDIWIQEFGSGKSHSISFDEEVYDAETGGYREFDTKMLRYSYESLATPDSVYDYDMETREKTLKKVREVPGGFESEKYEVIREWAKAPDGTEVPISILKLKSTPIDGSAPLYLYGYGSYGLSRAPDFSVGRLSLVDRGFVFALAHIRGGMDLGWDWYQNAKLLKKKNTFTDFIACAEHLSGKKYTKKGNIVACGGSAGGMLMGAIANERPDLFRAIIAHVPFVDVVNTMLDDTLPLTPIEYKEWGNPNEKEYFDYIRSYSPYDNVKAQNYPHFFITGGLNDPRVTYWEPAKWTAKLRETKTDDNLLLLKINMGFGHSGASGRFEYIKETAEEYAFILKVFDRLPN